MGVTIRFDREHDASTPAGDAAPTTTGDVDLATTAALVKAVCLALEAADFERRGLACLVFVDDAQFGCVAMHVRPQAFAAIVEGLEPGLRSAELTALAASAVAGNRLVELDEGLDRAWAGAIPTVSLGEIVDEPIAHWSNAHATHALHQLGYFDFSTASPEPIPARQLEDACRGRFDADALRIAEIAAYAIAQGGEHAMVAIA